MQSEPCGSANELLHCWRSAACEWGQQGHWSLLRAAQRKCKRADSASVRPVYVLSVLRDLGRRTLSLTAAAVSASQPRAVMSSPPGEQHQPNGSQERPSPEQATKESAEKHQRASLTRNYAEPRQPRVGAAYQVLAVAASAASGHELLLRAEVVPAQVTDLPTPQAKPKK